MKYTVFNRFYFNRYYLMFLCVLFMVLAPPVHAQRQKQTAGTLDGAISGAVVYFKQLDAMPQGSRVAFAYLTSPTEAKGLSTYILGELEKGIEGHFRVIEIEEQNLELVRQEIARADAEEVRVEEQLPFGDLSGVQFFIYGSIALEGDSYTIQIRAICRNERVAIYRTYVNKNDRNLNSFLPKPETPPFHVTAGLRAGVATQFWTLSSDINGAVESPSFAFEPAIHTALYYKDIALQVELAFSIIDKVSYSGTEAGGEYTASFESLSLRVPILVRYTFRPGNFSISPFAGVSLNIPLDDMKLHSTLYDDSSYRFSIPPSLVGGVNAGVGLGSGILFLDMRFSGEFNNTVIKDNSGTLALYNRNTLSITLGYEYEFGKK